MHVMIGVEIRTLSTIRGLFLDARRIFSFSSSTTAPACLNFTRGVLPGDLFEGSCRRRKRRSMSKPVRRWHVRPLMTAVSQHENVIICYPMVTKMIKLTVWPSGETGAGELAFWCTRNEKGIREPERKGGSTPVELD